MTSSFVQRISIKTSLTVVLEWGLVLVFLKGHQVTLFCRQVENHTAMWHDIFKWTNTVKQPEILRSIKKKKKKKNQASIDSEPEHFQKVALKMQGNHNLNYTKALHLHFLPTPHPPQTNMFVAQYRLFWNAWGWLQTTSADVKKYFFSFLTHGISLNLAQRTFLF